jgi:hypothetical protein
MMNKNKHQWGVRMGGIISIVMLLSLVLTPALPSMGMAPRAPGW